MKYINLSRNINSLIQRYKFYFYFSLIIINLLYQFYIFIFKNLSNYITLISSNIFIIMKKNEISHQSDDVTSFINDFSLNLQFFIIRFANLFKIINRILNIIKLKKNYINLTNNARLHKYIFILICISFFTS